MRVNWKRAVPTCAHYGWRGTANGSRRKSSPYYHPECLVRATGSRARGKMEKTPFYSLCFIVRARGRQLVFFCHVGEQTMPGLAAYASAH